LALGPKLSNDYYSLMMISDGDNNLSSSLYALRINNVPEPLTGVLLILGAYLTKMTRKI